MPRPNEHVCDIQDYDNADNLRNEPEDSDNAMHVDGKRVYRTYEVKGDSSELVMYRFPRDEGWDDATQTARSWCKDHDGEFEAMTGETEAGIYYRGDGSAQSLTAAHLMADVTGEPVAVWHPLIPLGTFFHPQFGEFETTREDAEEMLANFSEGLPTSSGIPIDEDPSHTGRTEGAYGWITDLEIKDEAIWAAIEWTDQGADAVESKRLPFVSARWFDSETDAPAYNRSNLIIAAALCTRPFFHDQPDLKVATVDYERKGKSISAADLSDMSREERHDAQQQRADDWGIEIRDDGSLSPPAEYRGECPNPDDYADPVNFKYPLSPEDRVRAAITYMSRDYDEYSDTASRRVVWTRIIEAAKGAGIAHEYGNPETLDKLLPDDLQQWAKENAGIETTIGDDFMAAEELYKKARAAYEDANGEVTDKEFDEIIEGIETEDQVDAFIAGLEEEGSADGGEGGDEDSLEGELARLRDEKAELEAKLKKAQGEKQELTEKLDALGKDVAELQEDKERAELESELAATVIEGNRQYTPEAISLMASMELNPSKETVKAFQEHLAENDGSVATVPMGEAPAITATNDEGELTGDAWLEAKSVTPQAKKRTRQIAQRQDTSIEAAYEQYIAEVHG